MPASALSPRDDKRRASSRLPDALSDVPTLSLLLDVAREGSFSRAAKKRGVTTSAVSKRVAQLEARLALPLFQRTTRRLSVTDAGRRLLDRVERVLADLADAEDELGEMSRAPRGVLRVATSVGLGQSRIGGLVAEFVGLHPNVSVELSLDERFVDLVRGRFDVGVRCGAPTDSNLSMKKLAPSRRLLCASPRYLERRGSPASPAELRLHDCLRNGLDDAGRTWRLGSGDAVTAVKVQGGFHADNPFVLRDAASAGLGVAFLPNFVIAEDVQAGRLVVVLPELAAETGWIYAALPTAKPGRTTRAFVDFIAAGIKASLR